ncbi:mannose-1-phosphate guanylyltransferase [bacterium]|nr:mannose-1-phosphate guanylyltransferase [bacterium]
MFCVVMAGGSGTRFWPRSRENKAKQYLKIFGKESLILSTIKRFEKIVGWDNIYIVSKSKQVEILKRHSGKVPESNMIFEPVGKNTAPCIGLAAIQLIKTDPNAVMIVTPSDHLVKNTRQFKKSMMAAAQLAEEENALVTIGIRPTRPSTGYGYIQINGDQRTIHGVHAFRVKTFAEKPNFETAQRFVESGDFFWNSGIFIFKASVILQAIEEHLPELHESLMQIRDAIQTDQYDAVLDRVYHQIRSVSIDYGVMELAKNVFMIRGDFTWNDLGSWDQVYKLSHQDSNANAVLGQAVLVDTKNSYISADRGVVAVIGMEDVVVVRDGDAVLVCPRKRSEQVKQIVERLKREKQNDYL